MKRAASLVFLFASLIMAISIPNPQITEGSSPFGWGYATNNGLLQDSANNLYYVTMAQLGTIGNPLNPLPKLVIYKSTDGGSTWTRIVADSNRGGDDGFGVSMVADVLHMVIINSNISPNSHLGLYRYDTVGNVFLANDYGGPNPGGANPRAALAQTALTDGTIVAAFLNGTDVHFVTWKAGVWSAEVNVNNTAVDPNNLAPLWLIKEKTTERVHLFMADAGHLVAPFGIWHISQESNGTLNTLQQIAAPVDWADLAMGRIGPPTIVGPDTQLVIAYRAGNQGSGAVLNVGSLRVLRGTVAANPVWSDEEAVSKTAIPNTEMAVQDGFGYFICSAISVGSQISLFFAEENQTSPGGTTQAWLYQVSSTSAAGGWGTPTILFMSPLGTSILGSHYPAPLTGISGTTFGIVIQLIAVDPAQIQYGDLNLFYIGSGSAPPPTPPSPGTYWNPGTSVSLLCERNYPWTIPPTDRIPVSLRGSIPAPVANVTTQLFEYQVPDGFWFVYDRIMLFATVTGYIDGAGSIIWILDCNVPTTGNPLPVGRPIAQFTTSAGELSEPVAVAPTQLYQGDTLRAKVRVADGTLGVGLPNVIHAFVEGWLFPHSRNL